MQHNHRRPHFAFFFPVRVASCILLAICLCLCAPGAGNTAPFIDGSAMQNGLSLLPYLEYVSDPAGELTIHSFSVPSRQTVFQPFTLERTAKLRGTTWLRFTIASPDQSAWGRHLRLDLGSETPAGAVLYEKLQGGTDGVQGSWATHKAMDGSIFIFRSPSSPEAAMYVRLPGAPGLWFAPTLSNAGPASASSASLAAQQSGIMQMVLTVALAAAAIVAFLRAFGKGGQWRVWTGVMTALSLVALRMPIPIAPTGLMPLSGAIRTLAAGLALLFFFHAGRHMMQTARNHPGADAILRVFCIAAAVLTIYPFIPGQSWFARYFALWPILAIAGVVPALLCLPRSAYAATRYGIAAVILCAGAGMALNAAGAPAPDALAINAPYWAAFLACCIMAIPGLNRAKRKNSARNKESDILLPDAAETGESSLVSEVRPVSVPAKTLRLESDSLPFPEDYPCLRHEDAPKNARKEEKLIIFPEEDPADFNLELHVTTEPLPPLDAQADAAGQNKCAQAENAGAAPVLSEALPSEEFISEKFVSEEFLLETETARPGAAPVSSPIDFGHADDAARRTDEKTDEPDGLLFMEDADTELVVMREPLPECSKQNAQAAWSGERGASALSLPEEPLALPEKPARGRYSFELHVEATPLPDAERNPDADAAHEAAASAPGKEEPAHAALSTDAPPSEESGRGDGLPETEETEECLLLAAEWKLETAAPPATAVENGEHQAQPSSCETDGSGAFARPDAAKDAAASLADEPHTAKTPHDRMPDGAPVQCEEQPHAEPAPLDAGHPEPESPDAECGVVPDAPLANASSPGALSPDALASDAPKDAACTTAGENAAVSLAAQDCAAAAHMAAEPPLSVREEGIFHENGALHDGALREQDAAKTPARSFAEEDASAEAIHDEGVHKEALYAEDAHIIFGQNLFETPVEESNRDERPLPACGGPSPALLSPAQESEPLTRHAAPAGASDGPDPAAAGQLPDADEQGRDADFAEKDAAVLTAQGPLAARFNLHELLHDACRALDASAEKQNAALSCGLSPRLPQEVEGDASLLQKTLCQLLHDGVCQAKNGTVRLLAEPGDEKGAPDRIIFTIMASGMENGARFQPSPEGMALALETATQCGGRLLFNAQDGKDAALSIELPCRASGPAPVRAASEDDSATADAQEDHAMMHDDAAAPSVSCAGEDGGRAGTAAFAGSRNISSPQAAASLNEEEAQREDQNAEPENEQAFLEDEEELAPEDEPVLTTRRTLLVADSLEANRHVFSAFLEGLPISIVEARNLDEARARYKFNPASMVVVEPELAVRGIKTVIDFFHELDEEAGRIPAPVIALVNDPEQAEALYEAGCADILFKPCSRRAARALIIKLALELEALEAAYARKEKEAAEKGPSSFDARAAADLIVTNEEKSALFFGTTPASEEDPEAAAPSPEPANGSRAHPDAFSPVTDAFSTASSLSAEPQENGGAQKTAPGQDARDNAALFLSMPENAPDSPDFPDFANAQDASRDNTGLSACAACADEDGEDAPLFLEHPLPAAEPAYENIGRNVYMTPDGAMPATRGAPPVFAETPPQRLDDGAVFSEPAKEEWTTESAVMPGETRHSGESAHGGFPEPSSDSGASFDGVDRELVPLIPELVKSLTAALHEASLGKRNDEPEAVELACRKLGAIAGTHGLRSTQRMAACVERAAAAKDKEAIADLLSELELMVARNVKNLERQYAHSLER